MMLSATGTGGAGVATRGAAGGGLAAGSGGAGSACAHKEARTAAASIGPRLLHDHAREPSKGSRPSRDRLRPAKPGSVYAIMRGNPRRVRAPPATDYARRSRAPSTRSCAGTLEGFAPLPRQTTPGEAGLRLRDHAREPSKGSRPLPRQTTPGEAGLRLRDHAREPSKG